MAQMPDPEIASTRIYGTLIRSRAESRQAGLGTRRARRRTRRVLGNGAVPTRCLGHPPWISRTLPEYANVNYYGPPVPMPSVFVMLPSHRPQDDARASCMCSDASVS